MDLGTRIATGVSRDRFALASAALLAALPVQALNLSVPRVNGDDARVLLGDGTGVVIGIVDSGVDDAHPSLAGNDSLGNPRLVAEANFVTTEPGNTGDDIRGHGTAVAGVALGGDALYTGIATDARYVNARVLDADNYFSTGDWVLNGAGFAVANGADVVNMSLGYFDANTQGNSTLSRMSDYLSYALDIPVVASAGNAGSQSGDGHLPQGPGDGFNVFSVGSSLSPNYDEIVDSSSYGPTSDGRLRPNISAPGSSIYTANDDWETGSDFRNWNGTSFAAPHVAGLLASQIDFGRAHGLSTDPTVLRATLFNSAEKINDRDNQPWEPYAAGDVGGVYTATSPLDQHSGSGQVDGLALHTQYSAGEQGPAGPIDAVGWDYNTLSPGGSLDYDITLPIVAEADLTATLTWERHVDRVDNGDGVIGVGDTFFQSSSLSNLELQVLYEGQLIARSVSDVDNVEHLHLAGLARGFYTLRVLRDGTGFTGAEPFALAWSTAVIPTGGTLSAALCLTGWLGGRPRRIRGSRMLDHHVRSLSIV